MHLAPGLPIRRGGWWAVMVAASDCNPLLSPTQAAGMMEEAAAAFQRCKRVVPPGWATMLRADRESCAPFHAVVTAHLAASPQRWQHGIRAQQMTGVRQGLRQVIDRNPEGQPLTCDGCGRPSAALKCCSRCKARRYVSVKRAEAGLGWKKGRCIEWRHVCGSMGAAVLGWAAAHGNKRTRISPYPCCFRAPHSCSVARPVKRRTGSTEGTSSSVQSWQPHVRLPPAAATPETCQASPVQPVAVAVVQQHGCIGLLLFSLSCTLLPLAGFSWYCVPLLHC